MEKKKTYLLNEKETEQIITDLMSEFDIEETEMLLKNNKMDDEKLDTASVQEIKVRVAQKLRMNRNTEHDRIKHLKKRSKWKTFAVSAAVVLFCVFAWSNSESIVHAYNKMFGLIPGVGIIEDEQDVLYQLESPVSVETDQGILNIFSVVATKDNMTVSFSFERKNYTEEQLIMDKQKEWERLKQDGKLQDPNVYLLVDQQKNKRSGGSIAAGGSTENHFASFELEEHLIHPSKTYTIQYEEYDIRADFQLIALEQYHSLAEIGATDTHNNISLTAIHSIADNHQLQVNVYPINYSKYNLVSFQSEYDIKYFGKKLALKTENGDKDYTLPGSYGSGMNAAYTFDVSDGSQEYILHIPFVVVESNEEQRVTLPIPKEGEVLEVNKEVAFADGTAIISSVEKVIQEGQNEYGHLIINLRYQSLKDSQQLVRVKATRKTSEGWFEDYDDQGRLKAIGYMLERSDRNKNSIRLFITQPRYVLLDEYNLVLNI